MNDFCPHCMTPLDITGDNPAQAPWPCEEDRLHCGDCADHCPACQYLDSDLYTYPSFVAAR